MLTELGSLPLNCFNFSTWEAEVRGLLQVESQAVLYSEFVTNLGHRVRPSLKNQQQQQ